MAKPAYQRIKEAILANIHTGVWQVGDAIATEIALANEFGVSRMTVNRALKELTEEQVLERRQGSGTFVAQKQFNHTFVTIRNIASDIIAQNKTYRADVIYKECLDFARLPQTLQHKFTSNNHHPTNVAMVQIVHFADNLPLQVEERWVDNALVPNFVAQDFTKVNTSDYLLAQIPLERGDYTIQATTPTPAVAGILAISPNEPMLLLTRRTLSQNQVVTVVKMWHLGSCYQFSGVI